MLWTRGGACTLSIDVGGLPIRTQLGATWVTLGPGSANVGAKSAKVGAKLAELDNSLPAYTELGPTSTELAPKPACGQICRQNLA